MSAATQTRTRPVPLDQQGGADARATVSLPCAIRGADGRTRDGELTAAGHRVLQLWVLHCDTAGFVELAAGRRTADGLAIATRRRADHFLRGGAVGGDGWLGALLKLAARHEDAGEEVFVGVATRGERAAGKRSVTASRWLWVDVDRPDRLDAVRAFIRERPAHLVVASGGSGGVHAYWRLARPLPAELVDPRSGEVIEAIERANDRLIHALGVDGEGRADVADAACRDRSRVMRLAGTRNHKTGNHARVVFADLELAPYPARVLVGDLPDPAGRPLARRRPQGSPTNGDHYRLIAAREYFRALAGITVPDRGAVRCPNPRHADSRPSCTIDGAVFHCHGCGEGGGIYDLASLVDGGPTGAALRGEQFNRAASRVRAAFGEP